ncbi:hypothetical protein [Pseudomonas caricapapayae]|uniref:hypothetical protein n=1 Tax=Pseudomonas caricapapayae TaxID=46678 RepID=UPI0011C3D33E|nr:hypothetical protein [Pseudomonas caricapapayae]
MVKAPESEIHHARDRDGDPDGVGKQTCIHHFRDFTRFRMLGVLWEDHHLSERSLEDRGYLGGTVNDSRPALFLVKALSDVNKKGA